MRKFLIVLSVVAMAFAAMSCSCDDNASFGIEYALNSNGNTDGSVTVTFPSGEFTLNGDASYVFDWSNADKKLFGAEAIFLDDALNSKDAKMAKAANKVSAWLESAINVTDAEGNYDVYVKGYVKETLTGLTFEIDRHFTNKE